MANSRRRQHAAGFMVVEVVVALAILSLGFGYAMRSLRGALERIGSNRHVAEAMSLAQSTLDRVGGDIALRNGDVQGSVEGGYAWRVEALPYTATPTGGPLVGYVVNVTVNWRERGNPRQISLTTLRLALRGQSS
ncbi:MAG: hypothetical protein WDN25_26130 [Acetobacteraceae bacterium]